MVEVTTYITKAVATAIEHQYFYTLIDTQNIFFSSLMLNVVFSSRMSFFLNLSIVFFVQKMEKINQFLGIRHWVNFIQR